jgi:hypothetical protein
VSVPTTIKADIYKWTAQDRHFDLDSDLPRYAHEVLHGLRDFPAQSRCIDTDDPQGLQASMWRVLAVLAQEHPDYFEVDAAKRVFRNKLWGFTLSETQGMYHLERHEAQLEPELAREVINFLQGSPRVLADAVRLSIQEDLAIIDRPKGTAVTGDRAEALLVCLPSSWNPADKIGHDFSTIHRPIAHHERLEKAHANLNKVLFAKPFKRWVWALVSDGILCHNPAVHTRPKLASVPFEQLYFRSERQTFIPMADIGRYVFTIRVYSTPLANVLNDERRQILADALVSMDDEQRAYKSLTGLVDGFVTKLLQ